MEIEIAFILIFGIFIFYKIFRFLKPSDYVDEHLRLVKRGKIEAQPIMNKSEMRLFTQLSKWQQASAVDLQLFSQVAMGEILRTDRDETRRSFNAKRLDFLFVDRDGLPVIAVEYQGKGHYGDDKVQRKHTEKRDQVKRLALEKAAICLVEIFPEDSHKEMQAKLNSAYNSMRS